MPRLITVLEGQRQSGKSTQLCQLADIQKACGDSVLILCNSLASVENIRRMCQHVPDRNILSIREFRFPCGGPPPNDWMTPMDFAMSLHLYLDDSEYFLRDDPERYEQILYSNWKSVTMTRCIGEDAALPSYQRMGLAPIFQTQDGNI